MVVLGFFTNWYRTLIEYSTALHTLKSKSYKKYKHQNILLLKLWSVSSNRAARELIGFLYLCDLNYGFFIYSSLGIASKSLHRQRELLIALRFYIILWLFYDKNVIDDRLKKHLYPITPFGRNFTIAHTSLACEFECFFLSNLPFLLQI